LIPARLLQGACQLLCLYLGTTNASGFMHIWDRNAMKAVIFAAALLAGASGWLLFDATTTTDASRVVEPIAAQTPSSLRKMYRAERKACVDSESGDRACELRARERLHSRIQKEAARVSLR
jgi:hypothetical protein